MAESGGEDSWWGWLQDAKEKVVTQSAEVYEFVKKDIDEFAKVVTDEASSVVSNTASSLKERLQLGDEESPATQMKKSVSGFLSHVAEVFTPPPEDEDQEALRICNQQPVLISRLEASIYTISRDPALFLPYSDEEEKKYTDWTTSFEMPPESEIVKICEENKTLKQTFDKLVPSKTTHLEFWDRYFYQVDLVQKAEKKREELKRRAQESETDDKMKWDEDDDIEGQSPIPDTVQQQLLEDYEKEEKNLKLKDEEVNDILIQNEAEKVTSKSPPKSDKKATKDSKTLVKNKSKSSEVLSEELKKAAEDDSKVESTAVPSCLAVDDKAENKKSPSSRASPSSTESNDDEWEKVDSVVDSSPDKSLKDKDADWEDDWK